jgi:glycosyltransferase involved in cell wall biosynthesis
MSADLSSLVASLQAAVDGRNPVIEPAAEGAAATTTAAGKELPNSTSRPLKLFLISTHFHQTTGYARVSHGLIHELAKLPWLSIVHYGIQGVKGLCPDRTYPSNVKVYDVLALEKKRQEGFGFEEVAAAVEAEAPDLVLIYNDLGIVCQYLEKLTPLRRRSATTPFQTWVYLDQVYRGQPPELLETLNANTDRVFCFTREWRDLLRSQGITRPVDVLAHGLDSCVRSVSKREARAALKVPEDTFLFFTANRNQPRKRLDLLVMAFVELIVKHPQRPLFLMCLCDKGEKGGYALFDIFARELALKGVNPEHFANRLMVAAGGQRFTDEEMNLFYSAADVGVSCAEGEGFGLCAFEQMSVGVPQVLSDVVGHREYCRPDNSLIVPTSLRYYMPLCMTLLGGEANAVSPVEFAKAMEQYVLHEDLRIAHGANAKKTVAAYTWTATTERFRRYLALLKEERDLAADT